MSTILEGSFEFRVVSHMLLLLQGSARRLVKTALQIAAKKREMRYSDLKKIDRGVRRHFHDDITVVVVYLDTNLLYKASSAKSSSVSLRGGGVNRLPSRVDAGNP